MLVTNALSQGVTVLAFVPYPFIPIHFAFYVILLSIILTCYIVYCSYYKRKNLSQINEKGFACLLSHFIRCFLAFSGDLARQFFSGVLRFPGQSLLPVALFQVARKQSQM